SFSLIAWHVENDDLSDTINDFRRRSIAEAERGTVLPTKTMLVLNFVIKNDLNLKYAKHSCNADLAALAYKLTTEMEEDEEEFELLLCDEKKNAIKEKDVEKQLLLSLVDTYSLKLKNKSLTTKKTYIEATLLPLFEAFLATIESTTNYSATGYLEPLPDTQAMLLPISLSTVATASTSASPITSKKRKDCLQCSWMSLELDYLVKAIFGEMKFDLFVTEVKKPNANVSQLVGDEAKLGNLMKIMADRLVLKSIPSPVVCGLIDDGSNIKTYKMTIRSDGKYDLIQLACFGSIRSSDDLVRLPLIIDHFSQLKTIIKDMQSIIRLALLGKVLPGPLVLPVVLVEWLRPSNEYPVAETTNKRTK
ncbi:hypothetical protein A0J61_08711, partial [Choanephora cucurbitarum]